MYDPRLDKLAQVLVRYSLGLGQDDLVRIKASSVAEPLVLALYKEAVRAGAHPVVRMTPGACTELLCKLGSKKQLERLCPLDMHEVETIDAHISVWADENTKALGNVDSQKLAMLSKARQPMLDRFLKRAAVKGKKRLRWTGTQYPCQASAQDAEMSLDEYADFVFRAGLLHLPNPAAAWKKIHVAQQRVCDHLDKGGEIRFVAPGTDITLGITRRRWINCAGHENFPDGEVFTSPIENSAEGEVHYTFPAVYNGHEVHGVRLKFKAGKVVDASADKNEDFLFKMLDQDRGARFLGEVAIGTNYAIKRFTRNTLFDEKIGGTFHLALGMAYPEAGGKNKSGLHWDMVCDLRKSGRIELDGKLILKNGRFTHASWPHPVRGATA
ncbi:MAG: aminopeptidase [Phycisphaerae bacterium]|nr:aminopeptidase [Phycisphaerae bacterium]